jgi:4-hydroxy-tetrahydrodipicolinate synthase
MRRRDFLALLGTAPSLAANAGESKPLRGIFPIAQTPFTVSDQLDLEALAAEVRFVARCGAHGFVWPQLASEYATLSEAERFAGAETILRAGKGLRPALVIGVQAPEAGFAVRYARHAAENGADAIIALPPPGATRLEALLPYYRAIGAATPLPLFMQAIGDLPVDQVAALGEAVPTLRYVKDEAGASPLARIQSLRSRAFHVFTGAHSVTLLDEMERGTAGSMPAAPVVDLYASAWDLWHSGDTAAATDCLSKALVFVPEVQAYGIQALKYLLYLRGVFPNDAVRGKDARLPLDDAGRKTLRAMLESVKPRLKV